jgi:ribulose-5-phosphate 4-epimerase/fuculose-1-phosphate aldolase
MPAPDSVSTAEASNTGAPEGEELSELASIMQAPERSPEEELVERKTKLAGALRVFGRFGFDEGVAGHITVRDPIDPDQFWVNPVGRSFKLMCVSDLIKVDHDGTIVEGNGALNQAAFAIHSRIHIARPDVTAAAHSHSIYGKAWSILGRLLDPLTQDACAFYNDHGLFDDYTGVVFDTDEGDRIAEALGSNKAAILRNHGLLTVGQTVDEAAFWFISMERSCQAQLLAEAAGTPVPIDPGQAESTAKLTGNPFTGHFSFQPIFDVLMKEEPDFLD